MKDQSGKGSTAIKQEKFKAIYTVNVGHIVTGERYDDAGVGPKRAKEAATNVYGDLDGDTISESLIDAWGGNIQSLDTLVADLDVLAEKSGQEQTEMLANMLEAHAEPSLVTLALLDDENIGLGTTQMRDVFFDGTRDERKHAFAFVDTTTEFIEREQNGMLPTRPTVGEPFSPMLAVSESRGEPDDPVSQLKIDGVRVLVHIKQEEDGPRAYAFTRQKNDVSSSLPELQEVDWPDSGEYILDGEVLAADSSYSSTTERIGRKAENVDRDVAMNFHFFDMLVDASNSIFGRYGVDHVWDKPFYKRYHRLLEFVKASVDDERVRHLQMTHGVDEAKDKAAAQDHEGIIVKNMLSPYEFGKRSPYWQKQKMDAETIDAVVSGFHVAQGEKAGTLGAIDLETADGAYIGKCGSGFSDEQRCEIWENRNEWLGRTVEVECRGIGSNGNARMPIFKCVRDEGEPDSWDRAQEILKEV